MMKSRLPASVTFVFLCLAAGAFGRGLSFQEHAAVQESLSRVHPLMRASWLRFEVAMVPGKLFTKGKQYEFRFTRSGEDSGA